MLKKGRKEGIVEKGGPVQLAYLKRHVKTRAACASRKSTRRKERDNSTRQKYRKTGGPEAAAEPCRVSSEPKWG